MMDMDLRLTLQLKRLKLLIFLVVQPDVIGIKKEALVKFYNYAKNKR